MDNIFIPDSLSIITRSLRRLAIEISAYKLKFS